MNVYYIKNFPGHYPIGTSAVIVARSPMQAFSLLKEALKEYGLNLTADDVGPADFSKLNIDETHAVILNDGNY